MFRSGSGSFRRWSCCTSWRLCSASAAHSGEQLAHLPHYKQYFSSFFCSSCRDFLTPRCTPSSFPYGPPLAKRLIDSGRRPRSMTATLEPTVGAGAKASTGTSPADVIRRAKEAGVQVVDVRFTDLPGTWQHFSIPLKELEEDTFTDGLGFDGSSIRRLQAIHENDMLLLPDPSSAFVDPCLEVPTLSLTCDIVDPITRQAYSRDPRYVARKAEAFLK